MAEYIERDAVMDVFMRFGIGWGSAKVKGVINSIPAADVRLVVRGKWKPIDLTYGRNYYFCSACEETVDMPTAMGIPMFRYCPNCGADMREES